MILLAWLFGVIALIVVIAIVVVFLNRFYRKTTRDVALVRTGFGGQKIVISGGCLALPFLHKVDEINMRTIRVEVSRAGEKSLITEDRIRVDVELEFYVRVQPTVDGVATAAQAIGSQSLNPEGIRNLLEGRFVDALQAAAAARRRWTRCTRSAASSCAHRRAAAREPVAQRGAARLGVADPPGPGRLRRARREQRLQRGGDAQAGRDHRHQQEAAHRDRGRRRDRGAADAARGDQARLDLLQQEEEQAQIAQRLEIEKIKAASDAETARAREQADGGHRERAHRARAGDAAPEITKQRELRRLEIEAQLELRDAQGRQLDRAGAEARRGGQGAGRGRTCAHRGRAGAGARADRARARGRRPLARDGAQARAGGRRGRRQGAKRDRGAADDVPRPKPGDHARAPRPSASACSPNRKARAR